MTAFIEHLQRGFPEKEKKPKKKRKSALNK